MVWPTIGLIGPQAQVRRKTIEFPHMGDPTSLGNKVRLLSYIRTSLAVMAGLAVISKLSKQRQHLASFPFEELLPLIRLSQEPRGTSCKDETKQQETGMHTVPFLSMTEGILRPIGS